MSKTPASEAARRRTFAIISHPDAGKTTLTEHLLLLGGAIHAAGRVKARGEARRAKSDWMKIEQERGIYDEFGKKGVTVLVPNREEFAASLRPLQNSVKPELMPLLQRIRSVA